MKWKKNLRSGYIPASYISKNERFEIVCHSNGGGYNLFYDGNSPILCKRLKTAKTIAELIENER
jgi:hypothetical protein